jgi:excisionase family DNA binding protein
MPVQSIHPDHGQHEEKIGIKEVAELLSISTATVRNWVKAGKIRQITQVGRTRLFDKAEILHLREEIRSGQSHWLKSRRNKQAVDGYVIPTDYVSSSQYVRLTEKIVSIAKQSAHPIDPKLVLLELVLNLLYTQGRIKAANHRVSKESLAQESLTEQLANHQLDLGIYHSLCAELYHPDAGLSSPDINLLREIRALEVPFIEGDDVLGLVYLSLSNLGQRKSQGSYYTPSAIADDLVKSSLAAIEQIPFPIVVDPCCGSGNFLIKLFISLRNRYLEAGLSLEEAEKRLTRNTLFGFDIDPTAVTLAKLNLALHHQSEPTAPFLFQIFCRNTLEQYGTIFAEDEHYDLVIGNPPWGYHFTREEIDRLKARFICGTASLESFCLFIEYGLSVLKEKGILAYVLPEALLNVKMHQETRRLLLDKSKIMSITLLGHCFAHVFTPTITVTAQKSADLRDDHHMLVIQNGRTERVPQRRFWDNDLYIFNVQASNKEERIVEHMKALPGVLYLKNKAKFALGIVTGNNKAFLSSKPMPGAEPVLKGSDVYKYNVYPGKQYLVFEPDKFQQVAPEHLYRAPEKLIYRFINEHLIFAYDNQQTLSLNSANVVIPELDGYSIKYILTVLNSRAAQFFHAATFSSVKVLRKHIESIPIPPCDPREQERLIQLVDRLLAEERPEARHQLYEKIDRIIMELYKLTEEDQQIINGKYPQVKFLSR